MEMERLEKKRIEDEKREKERKEKERKEIEEYEMAKKERERLEKEKKEKERLQKEKLEKERQEEEKKKEQEEHGKNFPNGITSFNNNISNKVIKFIHLDIEFKAAQKQIEVFDIFAPKKEGYKVIYYKNNKYFTVFPFYKPRKPRKEYMEEFIYFGIRDIKTLEFIDNKDIKENDYLKFNEKKKDMN